MFHNVVHVLECVGMDFRWKAKDGLNKCILTTLYLKCCVVLCGVFVVHLRGVFVCLAYMCCVLLGPVPTQPQKQQPVLITSNPVYSLWSPCPTTRNGLPTRNFAVLGCRYWYWFMVFSCVYDTLLFGSSLSSKVIVLSRNCLFAPGVGSSFNMMI